MDIFEDFEQGEDELHEADVPQEADEIEAAFEDGLDGIETCKRGLEEMAAFADDGDPGHLRGGLALLAQGLTELAETVAENTLALEELERPPNESPSGNFSW